MRFVVLILLAVLALSVAVQLAWADGWQDPAPTLALPTSFSHVNQTVTGSVLLPIVHDGAATIRVSAGVGAADLKTGSGDILTTSYKLVGDPLGGSADGDWLTSTNFVDPNRAPYAVTGPGDVTLWVQAASPAGRAPDAGDYAATLTLTLSW